jgi:methylated-DNA-protein-cysteine methyltransferase-like protein
MKQKQVSPFSKKVVELALMIPSGKVTSYGRIARAAGASSGRVVQSIAAILGRAYMNGQKDIPFHRIVYSDGRVWLSDSHPEYREKRLKLYKKEKIKINEKGKIENFEEKLFEYR